MVSRLPFIDWVRGFAVLVMVLWHTVDAWLDPALREGPNWGALRFLGGLAAPSFLFLAGLSAALSHRRHDDPSARGRAFRASLGRGLEVVLFGYLLRFQAWMIDAAAITQPHTWRAAIPIGAGYGVLVWSVNRLQDAPRRAAGGALAGALLCVTGYVQVEDVATGRLARLLQVDVLQAIGMSLVLLTLAERAFGVLRRPLWLIAAAVTIACLTEPLSHLVPGPLPPPLAAYLGKWPAQPGRPPASLFPLFPWLAYACLGAAAGALLRSQRANTERVVVALSVAGALLALITSESHAWIHQLLAAHAWLVPFARVLYRVGIVLTLFWVGHLWANGKRGRVLLDYGQASLRIYWIHMLFAYGVLGRPLQRSTDFGTWALFVGLLLLAMWGIAQWGRRTRQSRSALPRAVVPESA